MSLNINQFKAQMGAPAKPFLWNVAIPGSELISFKAQTAQLPGVGSTDMDLFYQGETVKYAGTVEYEHTWTLQVAESEDGGVIDFLSTWRALIYEQITGLSGSPGVYKKPITVQALKGDKSSWLSYLIKGCYPKNIDPVDLDRYNNSEAWKWNITFNFDAWNRL